MSPTPTLHEPHRAPLSRAERDAGPGLDPAAANELRQTMAVAASASKRDLFPWVVGAVSVGLLGALALGFAAQARFADSLTFLHRDKPVPSPLYAADWVEAPRTLDDIVASIRASRR